MSSIRIIIAGGGTGGHIFPAIAVANALKQREPSIQILFVGAKGKMEMERVPAAGYAIKGLDIAGFNRFHWWKNISLPVKLVKSFFQVRKIFAEFKPQGAFGVGGYSSYPVLRFAQSQKIPTFIHEANAFAGKSNRLLGKMATRIFVASAGMERFFPAGKISISGNPVRKEIADGSSVPAVAKVNLGLNPQKKTLLVMGGSLGARSINRAIANGLDRIEKSGVELLWQTGKSFENEASDLVKEHNWIKAKTFISNMADAYAAADYIISRAGAMSVAELCMVAKPLILVPYPHAAEDHQTANAMNLVSAKAACMVQDEMAGDDLVEEFVRLYADENRCETMRIQLRKMAHFNADEAIANEILLALQ